jgi:hypothetical protein
MQKVVGSNPISRSQEARYCGLLLSLSLPLYNQQLNCVAECSRVTANCLSREAP